MNALKRVARGERMTMIVIALVAAVGACLIVCVSVFCLKGLMHDE